MRVEVVAKKKTNFFLNPFQFCNIIGVAVQLRRLHDINCFLKQQIKMIRNTTRTGVFSIFAKFEWPRKEGPDETILLNHQSK
ncbi:hypothetical protein Hanom_Chr07g00626771 [Helianthus anomalus]